MKLCSPNNRAGYVIICDILISLCFSNKQWRIFRRICVVTTEWKIYTKKEVGKKSKHRAQHTIRNSQRRSRRSPRSRSGSGSRKVSRVALIQERVASVIFQLLCLRISVLPFSSFLSSPVSDANYKTLKYFQFFSPSGSFTLSFYGYTRVSLFVASHSQHRIVNAIDGWWKRWWWWWSKQIADRR